MTTVRILGSRAREQVPGTSITLLAPGFRGALTQLAPGVATSGEFDLPFSGAATGAEIMLAAQLTLNLEGRAAMEAPGLRSRSAVASYARVIVPRRHGVAYGLLQTDETGASSFVLPASHEESEAVFPLTIAAQGATRRTLRVLMWPMKSVIETGAVGVARRWEMMRRPSQLAQLGGDGHWRSPDPHSLACEPVLLLLHDTFSTSQATFAEWVGDESFAPIHRAYGGRCLAFSHPTLASSLEENLESLVTHFGQHRGAIDVVAHGRGGLLSRAIAADGRLPLRNVCQVGTPNKGTALAMPANRMRFLDAHVAMLARTPARVAQATLEGALCMLRFVALGLTAPLPGFEPLLPGASSSSAGPIGRDAARWYTVGAQFSKAGGHSREDLAEFFATPNDLVVPSDGCHDPGVQISDSLKLGGADVHHHNYFANQHVRDRLASWLVGGR